MIRQVFNSVFLLAFIWFFGLVYFNHVINNYEVDESIHTDAIVALTGGRNRIPEAINLLNKGMADKLFISGVQKDVSLKEISSRDDVTISTSREITLDNRSRNTIENAVEAVQWVDKNNIKSIRLVTSNYHIPRSLREIRARDKDLEIVINPVYSENVSKNCFFNWGSFSLIASEYNKFLYVCFKYLFLRK
ncbi:MAG: YdcF family protein [Lactobacillus sp.]|jgi:uncharacterized SAM-binding protein YcdF (DUF218 family)|nr:YdcF family protein [Lactobacillus sp.]